LSLGGTKLLYQNQPKHWSQKRVKTTKKEFKGIFVPIVTPFKNTEGQEIDKEKLKEQIRFLLENGVHGIFICSGTGEYASYSESEFEEAAKIAVDEVNGRVPVLAGAGSPGTQTAVKLARIAKDVGTDAVIVVGPYYNLPVTEEGIYLHYKTISERAEIPVWVYNLTRIQPYKDIPPEIIGRLANDGLIAGIKNSTDDILHHSMMLMLTKEKTLRGEFHPMVGPERFFLPFYLLGGKGNIATAANIAPKLHVELYKALERGNMEEAKRIHFNLVPLWRFGASPALVKEALKMIGRDCGVARLPLLPPSEDTKRKLREVLANLGLLK